MPTKRELEHQTPVSLIAATAVRLLGLQFSLSGECPTCGQHSEMFPQKFAKVPVSGKLTQLTLALRTPYVGKDCDLLASHLSPGIAELAAEIRAGKYEAFAELDLPPGDNLVVYRMFDPNSNISCRVMSHPMSDDIRIDVLVGR